ncbi:MAG: hypothetical protein AABZ13_05275 [Planctomycetota bacterium]
MRILRSFIVGLSKHFEGYFRFLCPLCSEFHTATNPKTNLALIVKSLISCRTYVVPNHKSTQELNSLERLEKTDKIKASQKTRKRIKTGIKGLEIITVNWMRCTDTQ